MAKWVINGKFLADRMQGIVRYARELVKALDEQLAEDDYLELVIPPDAHDVPGLKHIDVITWGRHTGIRWEQCDFRRYMRRNKNSRALNLCNTTPLFVQPGITAVHDIMYKVRPEYYTTLRNRISRRWHCFQYAYIARHELAIPTVSEFSKREIQRVYPRARGKVSVVSDAWQHVLDYECAEDWHARYPFLESGKFYFSMATLAKNKNGRWVTEVARRNPSAMFALAGKYYETEQMGIPENIRLLGFVSDADACALIKNCKAFLYPSVYEGFGLPPLEALALGAEVVSSNSTSLPEVLGESVRYVNPSNFDEDLEALLRECVAPREEVLERYSWHASSEKLEEILGEVDSRHR